LSPEPAIIIIAPKLVANPTTLISSAIILIKAFSGCLPAFLTVEFLKKLACPGGDILA
jgi:hypothetical protein